MDASLSGHDSHGVARTERYVMRPRQGVLNFGRRVETVFDGPGFALRDGCHGFGQTVGPQAVAVGVAKAREHGFAVVGLRRAGHLGRIGALAEGLPVDGEVWESLVRTGAAPGLAREELAELAGV